MKKSVSLLLIVALALIVSFCEGKLNPNYSYNDFCEEFGRSYVGPERDLHQAIFQDKYEKLL